MIAQPPIPVPKAEAAIVRYFGPGTQTPKCRRFAPHLVGCDYTTPSGNVGVTLDGAESTWYGFATVDGRGVHAQGM